MKVFALLLASVLSTAAQAEIFKCAFTEPFATITYTTGTQLMVVQTPTDTHTYLRVGFLITGPNKYELTNSSGAVLMEMTLTGNGSDGMSNVVYPFTAKYSAMLGNTNAGMGGCSSLKLPSTGTN